MVQNENVSDFRDHKILFKQSRLNEIEMGLKV